MSLLRRSCWVFDLDGTLTEPIHDFDAIRRELGIPLGRPILEALASFPRDEAERLHARLLEIEWGLAERAVPARGAHALVEALEARGARIGVLTRNDRGIAVRTLEVIGLGRIVDVLGRDEATIKPDPAGIHVLLERWSGAPGDGVMVGDTHYDVRAGRAAGVASVLVGPDLPETWRPWTDLWIRGLDELLG